MIDKLDHDLNLNRIERAKTNLYIKSKSIISGLHVLAENKIPESILHADTLANILLAITHKLEHDNRYSLLYGREVNAYYHMSLIRSFIINDVLFMTIMLPFKHSDAPVLSIYRLYSHYLPTNMSMIKWLQVHTHIYRLTINILL